MTIRIWNNVKQAFDNSIGVSNKGLTTMGLVPGIGIEESCKDIFTVQLGTGVLDRNLKEIFEGDIVEVLQQGGGVRKFTVRFGRFTRRVATLFGNMVVPMEVIGFYFESDDGYKYLSIKNSFGDKSDLDFTTIIGNIFE